jgi:hypothetical protein
MGEIRGEQEMGEGVEIWNLGEWKMDENRILEGKDLRLELPLAQYTVFICASNFIDLKYMPNAINL